MNNYPTEAGRSNRTNQSERSQENKVELVDAINQVFTLFRLNYHNQYLKAFGNTQELNEVKRLWLEILQRFDPATLLRAAKTIIENSEYLPTLHTMIHACERANNNAQWPDAHSAYIEACRAPSPKASFNWSHPLVYYAGKMSDWYFLQSSSESVAYPIFKQHYEDLIKDFRNGVNFEQPSHIELPNPQNTALDKDTNKRKLDEFRKTLKL